MDMVRYDNLPLFITIEKGRRVGKIGLIDLEHIKELVQDPDNDFYQIQQFSRFKDLVRIFPYHLDLIKAEAEKIGLLEGDGWDLTGAAKRGENF